MKKLFSTILVLSLLLSGNAYAFQISCQGVNAPNQSFFIKDGKIGVTSNGWSLLLDKKWVFSSTVYKGEKKINNKLWEVQIDIKKHTATLITTTYNNSTTDEVYVRNYINCD